MQQRYCTPWTMHTVRLKNISRSIAAYIQAVQFRYSFAKKKLNLRDCDRKLHKMRCQNVIYSLMSLKLIPV